MIKATMTVPATICQTAIVVMMEAALLTLCEVCACSLEPQKHRVYLFEEAVR